MRITRVIAFAVLVLVPGFARAQSLANRVPSDAVVYLGWKGADSPGNGYAGSHLAAVIDASNFTAFKDEFIPQALQKAMAKNGDNGDGARGVHLLLDIFWRHPTALYFAGMNTGADGKPVPKFGLLCQAGDDANTLLTLLKAAIASGDQKDPSQAFESGNVIAFTFGYTGEGSPLPDEAAGNAQIKPLSTDSDFARVIKQISSDPFVTAYVDTTKLMGVIDKAVADGADEQAKAVWPKVRDASGLLGLKHVVCGSGFDGRDWASSAFVDAPAPRTGLLTLVEPKPIDADLLGRIPATAGFAKIGQFNVGGILTQVRAMMVSADADGGSLFDKGMAVVQLMIGRNLKTDVLDPMGTQWAVYSDNSISGNPLLSTVVVNKLTNADKAKTGWTMLSYAVNNAGAGVIRQKGWPITLSQNMFGDLRVYTIDTPVAQPSWGVSKGYMYFGLTPMGVATATSVGPTTKPFAGSERFETLKKKLAGDATATSFDYADLPATAAAAYPQVKSALEQVDKLLEPQGLKLPENLLPPLEKVTAELAPAAQVAWADDTGFHVRGTSPFPGSDLFSSRPTTGAASLTATGAQILGPSLNRARQTANSVESADHLKEIGHQLLIYAAKNNGKFPADLATLVAAKQVKPLTLINSNGSDSLPANFDTLPPDDQKAFLSDHGSYLYGGAGLDMTTVSDTTAKAIAREKDGEGFDGKVNVLFVDGHVEPRPEAEAKGLVGK